MKEVFLTTFLWVMVTVGIFQIFSWVFHKLKRFVLFHPVAWTIASLVVILLMTKVEYKSYFHSTLLLHLLLGPSTVALALPLYEQRAKLKSLLRPLFFSLFIGSLTGICASLGLALFFKASLLTAKSVAAKSVTTPIAIGIVQKLGGDVSLTAVIVILTGIFGAMFGVSFLRLLPFKDEEAKGFALGMGCHGIGTARAFEESKNMGAFSGLAIGLNGLMTALLLPLIFKLWGLG